jgi:hypothetical protein
VSSDVVHGVVRLDKQTVLSNKGSGVSADVDWFYS